MSIYMIFFTAVALAMDAFAVSVSNGICVKDFKPIHGVKTGIYFGLFQFIMPLIGWLLGTSFSSAISSVDHWIAFILLGFIGGKMIWDAFKQSSDDPGTEKKDCSAAAYLTFKLLIVQAIATSIDALAVGVSFAMLNVNVWAACTVIGAVAFVLSFLGGILGKKIGLLFEKKAQLIGGLILVFIGSKILIEHLIG